MLGIRKYELVSFLDLTDQIADNDSIESITASEKSVCFKGHTVEGSHQQAFELNVPVVQIQGKGIHVEFDEDNKIIIN